MVKLTGVSKGFVGQARVLDQVDLQLRKGDFLYVVGGSGAGKSTLLRLLATEERPTTGAISLFGYDLARVSPTTLRAIRRSVGYIPQNVRLIPDLSVQDNVALSLSLAGRRNLARDARARIGETLEKLGLGALRSKLASQLSGGEAQRVAVARALVRQPELIIGDEPTGAQDHDYVWALMDCMVRANAGGSTIVLATHDRDIVRRVRKRCAVLRGGKLSIEGGSPLCI